MEYTAPVCACGRENRRLCQIPEKPEKPGPGECPISAISRKNGTHTFLASPYNEARGIPKQRFLRPRKGAVIVETEALPQRFHSLLYHRHCLWNGYVHRLVRLSEDHRILVCADARHPGMCGQALRQEGPVTRLETAPPWKRTAFSSVKKNTRCLFRRIGQ